MELMAFFSAPPGSSSPFIYLFHLHLRRAAPRLEWSRAGDRQVHYTSPEFKVMLCLLWLLSSALASLRYPNARGRIAKSGPIPSGGLAVPRLRRSVMKESARD